MLTEMLEIVSTHKILGLSEIGGPGFNPAQVTFKRKHRCPCPKWADFV